VLGAAEFGLLVLLMRATGVMAPTGQAALLFAGGWIAAQLLGHAVFPWLRLSYSEDGGELGRLGIASAVVVGVVLAGSRRRRTRFNRRSCISRPECTRARSSSTGARVLVGEPGAIVRGGIVVRANGVTIRNVAVVGGENGISVEGYRDTMLDGVSVSGANWTGSTSGSAA